MDENQEEGQKLAVQGKKDWDKKPKMRHEARQINGTPRQWNKDKNGTDWKEWNK